MNRSKFFITLALNLSIAIISWAKTSTFPNIVGLKNISKSYSAPPETEQLIKLNRKAINTIIKNFPAFKAELIKRMNSSKIPFAYRVLYAAILTSMNEKYGQKFLIEKAGKAIKRKDIKNLFWTITNSSTILPEDDKRRDSLNLKWAEKFMVKEYKNSKIYNSFTNPRRPFVMNYFLPQLLAMNNAEVNKIINPNKKSSKTSREVNLNDKRAVLILIGKLMMGQKKSVEDQLDQLVKINSPIAINALLRNINNPHVYPYLLRFHDPRIMPAIKKLAAKANGEIKLELNMIIAQKEKKDIVPILLALPKSSDIKVNDKIMTLLAKSKDKRTVPYAIEVIASPQSLTQSSGAIEVLGRYKSAKTVRALISGFYVNYNSITTDRRENYNLKYFKLIVKFLKKHTGENFGFNRSEWLEWYIENKSDLPSELEK